MNKKILKQIEKELKKEKSIVIGYEPTLEEIEYLSSRNIKVNLAKVMRQCLLADHQYQVIMFEYIAE